MVYCVICSGVGWNFCYVTDNIHAGNDEGANGSS